MPLEKKRRKISVTPSQSILFYRSVKSLIGERVKISFHGCTLSVLQDEKNKFPPPAAFHIKFFIFSYLNPSICGKQGQAGDKQKEREDERQGKKKERRVKHAAAGAYLQTLCALFKKIFCAKQYFQIYRNKNVGKYLYVKDLARTTTYDLNLT